MQTHLSCPGSSQGSVAAAAPHPCLDRAQSTLRQWKVSWGRGCDGMSFQVPPNPNHTLIFGCSVLLKWQSRGRAAQEPPAPPWSRQHRVAPAPCYPDSRMGTGWGHLGDILGTSWGQGGATQVPPPHPSPAQELCLCLHPKSLAPTSIRGCLGVAIIPPNECQGTGTRSDPFIRAATELGRGWHREEQRS